MSTKVNGSGSTTHGNSCSSSFRDSTAMETTFRAGESTETEGKKVAMAFLNEAIDASGLPRKQVADTIGKSEPSLSKMTTGLQAFGLDDFESLPHHIQVDWFKKYAHRLGLEVREIDALELALQVLVRFEEFAAAVRLMKVGRPRMAQAEMIQHAVDRRRA